MASALKYVGQGVVYGAIALMLGYFSDSPRFVHFPSEQALIKLTFAHGAKAKGGCRRLTAEEIAALAPNMRRPTSCPRQRLPVTVELELDGQLVYRDVLPPTGLSGDGPSRVYQGFPVPAGRHKLVARLRDSARTEGYDYENAADVVLAPKQHYIISFRAEAGGFIFK